MKTKKRIRFHLGKGEHFMKWQVKDGQGNVEYYDTDGFKATLIGAKLVNQRGTAERINRGSSKTVCAWIEFDSWFEHNTAFTFGDDCEKLRYNPKVLPYWNIDGNDVDGREFVEVHVNNRELFIYKGEL